jgi:hypothetical protein
MRVNIVDECRATWDEAIMSMMNRDSTIEYHQQIRVARVLLLLALNVIERPEEWAIADFGNCLTLTGPALTQEQELELEVTPIAGDRDGA